MLTAAFWTGTADRFVGMSTDGELASAAAMVKAGCPEMWVELGTWNDYDSRSHYVCGLAGAATTPSPATSSPVPSPTSVDTAAIAAAVADLLTVRLGRTN